MATLAIPPGGIKLHGFGENRAEQKAGTASALLLRLDKALLQEFRAASHAKDSLQLLTGSTPVGLPIFIQVMMGFANFSSEASDRRTDNRPKTFT